jgi:CHAD domain-containing protein
MKQRSHPYGPTRHLQPKMERLKPGPVRKPRAPRQAPNQPGPTMDWEKTLKGSLQKRWRAYRQALKHCQRKFSEKSVHASRVETRRLLSLVELLGVFLGQSHLKKTQRVLKQHLDAFDPLRDTQVQLLLIDKHQRQFPETKLLRELLARREKRCLKRAKNRIRRVQTRRLKEVLHDLSGELIHLREDAVHRSQHRAAVLNAVHEAFEQVVKLQRLMDPGAAETIHRTRVAFKKFRYMVEAMQPLLDGITARHIAAMQDYQSMMGDVQDSEVFLARLDKSARGHHALAIPTLAAAAAHRANHPLRATRRPTPRILAHCLPEKRSKPTPLPGPLNFLSR